jgi:hypothetical protein
MTLHFAPDEAKNDTSSMSSLKSNDTGNRIDTVVVRRSYQLQSHDTLDCGVWTTSK